MRLATRADAADRVRARALDVLAELQSRIEVFVQGDPQSRWEAERLRRFFEDPREVLHAVPPRLPLGPPIGCGFERWPS